MGKKSLQIHRSRSGKWDFPPICCAGVCLSGCSRWSSDPPPVCPVQLAVNPVHGQALRGVQSLAHQYFAVAAIQASSLDPSQAAAGIVHLRTTKPPITRMFTYTYITYISYNPYVHHIVLHLHYNASYTHLLINKHTSSIMTKTFSTPEFFVWTQILHSLQTTSRVQQVWTGSDLSGEFPL